MSIDGWIPSKLFSLPRAPLARRVALLLLCFYSCVGSALGVLVVAPTVHELRREQSEYRALLSGAAREEELEGAVGEVRARLATIRSDLGSHGPQILEDRVIHATLRDAITKAGMEMTGFESLKTVGEYSLTIKGAFANAVMLLSDGLTKIDRLRVKGFTARGIESPPNWIELHFSLKTKPYPNPQLDRCGEY